jgi:hypothetical protein
MKAYVHLWSYVAQYFLEWEMFYTEVVEKIKTHILCSMIFSRKSCRLWDNVKKYSIAGEATDDNKIRRMCAACWITKATNTRWEYVIHIAFPRQQLLSERASVLRCTYFASFVYFIRMALLHLWRFISGTYCRNIARLQKMSESTAQFIKDLCTKYRYRICDSQWHTYYRTTCIHLDL